MPARCRLWKERTMKRDGASVSDRAVGGSVPGPLVTRGATRLCKALRKDGTPCRAQALDGKEVCSFHDKRKARAFREGRKAGVRRRLTPLAVTPDSEPMPDLGNAEAVVAYIGRLIGLVERGKVEARIANAISVLASNLLRALNQTEMLARVARIEAAIKALPEGQGEAEAVELAGLRRAAEGGAT